MNKSTLVKDALILTAITLVAGLLLGLVYGITKEPIAVAQENAKQASYSAVFAEADHFEEYEGFDADAAAAVLEGTADTVTTGNVGGALGDHNTIDSVMVAYSAANEALGYVITVTDNGGYGGELTFSVGIQTDGTVNGIAFTSLNETAGLGMKAKDEGFASQFSGRVIAGDGLSVNKSGTAGDDEIAAISGATITSSAVTSGVNAAVAYFRSVLGGVAS